MEDQSANYIPLKEAAGLCNHSQDYLNLLVRKGKLKAMKIGRNWVTKKEWLAAYLAVNRKKIRAERFISLRDAAGLCNHSQDYLNLLVRKRKLKAMKIGRNWVTTNEWLQEYQEMAVAKKTRWLQKADRAPAKANISKDETSAPLIPAAENFCGPAAPQTGAPPPAQNPRSRFIFFRTIGSRYVAAGGLALCAAIAFVATMVLRSDTALMSGAAPGAGPAAAGLAANPGGLAASLDTGFDTDVRLLASAADDLWGAVTGAVGGAAGGVKDKFLEFADFVFHGKTSRDIAAVTPLPANNLILERSANDLEQNIIDDTRSRMDQFRQTLNIPGGRQQTSEKSSGMVVVPLSDSGDKEEMKQKISESFSDEVSVVPDDGISGIIIPDFRDKEADQYLYMMVPVDSSQK